MTPAETPPGEQSARIYWQVTVGDDRLAAVIARDLDGDGAAEIALASHSGFAALLGPDGAVRWVRFAGNQVTDLTPLPAAEATELARTSLDGSLVVLDAAGQERARWYAGEPLQRVAADGTLLVAAGDRVLFGGRVSH